MKRFILSVFVLLQTAYGVSANLIDVSKKIPSIVIDLRYATRNNFTGKQIYPSNTCCYVHQDLIEPLKKVQSALGKKGCSLKIWDGWRPFSATKKFWKLIGDERYVANPKKGGSGHNRGTAVDVTLVDLKTKEELPMGTEFDDFSRKAHRTYKKFSKRVQSNRSLLENVMIKYGFTPLISEWWHFDFRSKSYPIIHCDFSELN